MRELKLTQKHDCVEFEVRTKPNAKRTAVVGAREGVLDVRIGARPIEGAANEELLGFLAGLLEVPQRDVRLLRGGSSRHKRIGVFGLSVDEVRTRIPY